MQKNETQIEEVKVEIPVKLLARLRAAGITSAHRLNALVVGLLVLMQDSSPPSRPRD